MLCWQAGKSPLLFLFIVYASACMTEVDYRMEQGIADRQVRLSEIEKMISLAEDKIVRQRAILRVQSNKAITAAEESRLTHAELDQAQAEIHAQTQKLAAVHARLAEKNNQLKNMMQQNIDAQEKQRVKREIVSKIAQLNDEVHAIGESMRRQAEQRAKKYDRPYLE